MATGDGLLARLSPIAALSIDAWLALCAASERHGNGIIEVTQRGNLQFRGLSAKSAPAFANEVVALGLGREEHPTILAPPLLGLEPQAPAGLQALVARLRAELPAAAAGMALGPKVSLIVDGGGALHLDEMTADVRLRLCDGPLAHLSMAGNAASSTALGWIDPAYAPEAIIAVFAMIARQGIAARARDVANGPDLHALRSTLPGRLADAPPPPPMPSAEPIGMQPLDNGHLALGVAPPFGSGDAGTLKRFAEAAAQNGAHSIRPAPGRALLAIGLDQAGAMRLVEAADALGFIVQPADPRRFVFACAGAPACTSAQLDTRALAPRVARAAAGLLHGANTVHVSGCAKGCAHPGKAAMTFVGPGHVVLNGKAGDPPQGRASAAEFIAGLRAMGDRQEAAPDLLAGIEARRSSRQHHVEIVRD